MSKKITFSKIVILGLISTTFAMTNIDIANSRSSTAINIELGTSANAGTCNSRCRRKLGRLGRKVGRSIWRKATNREEERSQ